ncbi:uncharacterized protein LOC128223973 isoform X2 [Mya arenaria]|uniref:uncharacterized protein LOC128223973 isoform X2 n=1 Tax=Mya arenaria TaxID=6604 RepID=UPI0022E7E4AB|nr:uncharacterized protein LOC128223973 isoform X2 [Mya arenaria]
MSGVEAFIGSWREEEKEGYEEMASALGLPAEKKDFFKNARTEITYRRDGDFWEIDVGMQGVPQTRTFISISVVTVDGNKLIEKHIDDNLHGMDMNITRYIAGGQMIVNSNSQTMSDIIAETA